MELIDRVLYNLMEVHPLHTLIVHFPIALTSSALFFILLALWQRNDALEKVAFANLALASASTLAAGVTGWLDNVNTYDGAAPNAGAKMALVFLLLGVTGLTSIARWRNPGLFSSRVRLLYVGSYFASFGLVAVLGFLGGIILYGFEERPVVPVTGGNANAIAMIQPLPTPSPEPTLIEEPATEVSFARDIFPILKSRCANCHGGQKIEDGLDLTSYTALMTGSENGPVVIPSDAANSSLAKSLLEKKMPKRGPKLKPEQVQMIIDWISQGAPDN